MMAIEKLDHQPEKKTAHDYIEQFVIWNRIQQRVGAKGYPDHVPHYVPLKGRELGEPLAGWFTDDSAQIANRILCALCNARPFAHRVVMFYYQNDQRLDMVMNEFHIKNHHKARSHIENSVSYCDGQLDLLLSA